MAMEQLINKVTCGDCLEIMKQIPDNSIDLIVTDPPYGYNFMNKSWDVLPSVDTLKECLRVLKDGAFSFWCMTPRQDCQMEFIFMLKQAGFNVGFTPIFWAYSSGFPKAANMSKLVDKRLGVECTITRADGSTGGSIVTDLNTQKNVLKLEYDEKLPTSPEAKALDGSYAGFQPKPAVEVIIVAMKPLSEKSYTDQALKNGKGVTWLGDGRIPFVSDGDKAAAAARASLAQHKPSYSESYRTDFSPEAEFDKYMTSQGRFPANLLVSDDVLNDGVITTATPTSSNGGFGDAVNTIGENANGKQGYSDSGSFSRYFDLDRWFSERIKKLPKEVRDTFPFLIVPKPAKSEKEEGCEKLEEKEGIRTNAPRENEDIKTPLCLNSHPTVKPVDLMSYLITIGSRPNDIILEPFCGSGTTMVSSWLMNRKCIGIELNPDYVKIAEARFKEYNVQQKLDVFSVGAKKQQEETPTC